MLIMHFLTLVVVILTLKEISVIILVQGLYAVFANNNSLFTNVDS